MCKFYFHARQQRVKWSVAHIVPLYNQLIPMHSSILRRIWLICLVFIGSFSVFTFPPRISNFFNLSINEETWLVEMRISCTKFGMVLVLHITMEHSTNMIDWLIDWLILWRHHHCRWRAAKFRSMLGTQGLWTRKYFYRATPAVTRDLGFSDFIRRTDPTDPPSVAFLRHAWGCEGPILTQVLTGFQQILEIEEKYGGMWEIILYFRCYVSVNKHLAKMLTPCLQDEFWTILQVLEFHIEILFDNQKYFSVNIKIMKK
jgi:hypothetical protein